MLTEMKLKFFKNENGPGIWRYVMAPDLYSTLDQDKMILSVRFTPTLAEPN